MRVDIILVIKMIICCVCNKYKAKQKCPYCKLFFYCCDDCQVADWVVKDHDLRCDVYSWFVKLTLNEQKEIMDICSLCDNNHKKRKQSSIFVFPSKTEFLTLSLKENLTPIQKDFINKCKKTYYSDFAPNCLPNHPLSDSSVN